MQLPVWKQKQEQKKFKKQKRLISLFVFFVFLLLILALSFRFYLGFKDSKIRFLNRVNFLINFNQLYLVSLSSEGRIYLLGLPGDQEIQLTRGFGRYKIKAIFPLGELENKGLVLLEESIQEYFGLPIMGAIGGLGNNLVCDFNRQDKKKCLETLILNSLLGKARSDFDFAELTDLWWKVKKTSDFSLETGSLEKLGCQTEQGEVDLKCFDLLAEKNFSDESLVREDLSVAVFNSTEFSGLGAQAARMITNSGGRVVSITNSDLNDKVLIKSKKEIAQGYTFRLLKEVFKADWVEGSVEQGRAEIGIYLGQDYWKKLNQKW